ncbi:hypothetical protein [Bradyrhizobium sp. McL0616]|uniref:hypothetical protein n=1 Tax=Bradyrhizobium sp. McL0616 TaxID=3415674 RepID=UPI003CED5591
MTKGWARPFEDPIEVNGRTLAMLLDAGRVHAALPNNEHDAPEWLAAMEALLLVVERGGPTLFAWIGIMRALNRHQSRSFNPCGMRRDRCFRGAARLSQRSVGLSIL